MCVHRGSSEGLLASIQGLLVASPGKTALWSGYQEQPRLLHVSQVLQLCDLYFLFAFTPVKLLQFSLLS